MNNQEDHGQKILTPTMARSHMVDRTDWKGFYKAALTGMLAHPKRYKPKENAHKDWHYAIAEEAAEIADAMVFVMVED